MAGKSSIGLVFTIKLAATKLVSPLASITKNVSVSEPDSLAKMRKIAHQYPDHKKIHLLIAAHLYPKLALIVGTETAVEKPDLNIKVKHSSSFKSTSAAIKPFSTAMLDKKIPDRLLHDIPLIAAGFIDQYPDAPLKGPIQIILDKELHLFEFRVLCFIFRYIH